VNIKETLNTIDRKKNQNDFFSRVRSCIGIEKIDEDPDYYEADRKKKKPKPITKNFYRATSLAILILSLIFVNVAFVYGYVYMSNLLNEIIGLNIPMNETQIRAVSYEILYFLRPMVLSLIVSLFGGLLVAKKLGKAESTNVWL